MTNITTTTTTTTNIIIIIIPRMVLTGQSRANSARKGEEETLIFSKIKNKK